MSVRASPPLPRSGRLMTGGPNSLELLWAVLALAAVAMVAAVSAIGWVALWIESQLAGNPWETSLWEMPRILLDVLSGRRVERLVL